MVKIRLRRTRWLVFVLIIDFWSGAGLPRGPIGAGLAAGVQSNDAMTLKALLEQVPADQKERLKARTTKPLAICS